jgi:aminoglycoside phosphotransferase (APT) family kinase protein
MHNEEPGVHKLQSSPEHLLVAARGFAADAVGCPFDRVTEVSRFPDGNRHAVYKVSYLEGTGEVNAVVVRVSYGANEAECETAEREARVLRTVGGRAVPALYDFRCMSRWLDTPAMCMQFVPGCQRELSSASTAEIEKLGSVLAWVHQRPVYDLADCLGPMTDIVSYAEARLESILSGMAWVRGLLPGPVRSDLHRAADSALKSWKAHRDDEGFKASGPLALLHGDPALGNILWGPEPVFIDWEYARLGDPADEIAYLFDQNGLDSPQRQSFWQGYAAGMTDAGHLPDIESRAEWWEPLTLLGSTLWWVERWVRRAEADAVEENDPVTPREASYYSDRATSRLDRLTRLLTRR